jgi:membrane protein
MASTLDRLREMREEIEHPPSRRSAATGSSTTGPNASDTGGAGREAGRGREADDPRQVPARGWKDILVRAWQSISENNLFLVSGGVTYGVLLALFPGLAALVSLYGLVLNPDDVERQVGALSGVLPEQSLQMLQQQLHSLVTASSGALGFGAIFGLLLALWSASRGMSGMLTALNIAYGQKETRSFIRFNLLAIALTLGAILGGVIAIGLIGGVPVIVNALGLGGLAKWAPLILEWPLVIVVLLAGLAVMYRYGPNRDEPQWRWVSPGAITAAVMWIIGSIAFTIYVANFSSYDKTYGTLGGAVVLLTWLYLSALCVLVGAVINAQSERQTRKDTTEGAPRPMGERGAHAADTLGPAT